VDSLAAVSETLPDSPELIADLETRLAEFEANPEVGHTWSLVKSKLRDGSWRTA